jgi:hypothetical protein
VSALRDDPDLLLLVVERRVPVVLMHRRGRPDNRFQGPAYRDVVEKWPEGDKVPAALYKLGIAYQKTNRSPEARTTFRTLIDKYPRSGEARLAEERLKEMDQR